MSSKENIRKTIRNQINDEEVHPLKPKTDEEPVIKSMKYKIVSCFKNITVEPVLFFFMFPVIIEMTTFQNLLLEKACRVTFNYSTEICDALKAQTLNAENEYEKNVQKFTASIIGLRSLLTATLPTIIVLFMGSWTDRSGRRTRFLLLVIGGHLVLNIFSLANIYFFYDIPVNVFAFTDAFIEGITGSWSVILSTGFSYISAVTNAENRTYRMGIMTFCATVGFPIGMGLSGFILKKFGYYGCYTLTALIHVVNLFYILFVFKDIPLTKENLEYYPGGICNFLRTYFDLTNMKECITVMFKPGPNNRRTKIGVLLVIVCLLFGPMHAEMSIMYLSTRLRFNWDELKFSMFQSYNFVTHTVGTIFSIIVFSKVLKWDDSLLGIISTGSKMAAAFVYCFAINEVMFFAAPMVEILNGTSLLAMRTIISKIVDFSELGKVNSVLGVMENLMPLFYVPLYTKVYTATMSFFPGFVFLLGAALTLPAFVVFSWFFYEHRKEVSKARAEAKNLTPLES